MRTWEPKRGRSFIWARPLRERPFPRRFWVFSALAHLAAFGFLRSEAFDLEGRAGRSAAASARSPRAAERMVALDALQVVEIAILDREPEPERPAPDPEPAPLDVERLLERLGGDVPAPGVSAPAAPAASAGGDGGPYSPPVPLAFRWPEYPDGAPRAEGPTTVVVRVRVGPDGEVERVELERPAASDVLNRRALDVARGVRFSPARREGRRVAAWFSLPVTFNP